MRTASVVCSHQSDIFSLNPVILNILLNGISRDHVHHEITRPISAHFSDSSFAYFWRPYRACRLFSRSSTLHSERGPFAEDGIVTKKPFLSSTVFPLCHLLICFYLPSLRISIDLCLAPCILAASARHVRESFLVRATPTCWSLRLPYSTLLSCATRQTHTRLGRSIQICADSGSNVVNRATAPGISVHVETIFKGFECGFVSVITRHG